MLLQWIPNELIMLAHLKWSVSQDCGRTRQVKHCVMKGIMCSAGRSKLSLCSSTLPSTVLPASHTLHIWPSQTHIFLQEQVFSNARHSLNFQRGKTHPVEKQHLVAALWRSPSPKDRVFLGIYNIKRVHLNEAEHRRASESARACCCPKSCCHLADAAYSS